MKITLPYKFKPRPYQVEAWNAIMHEEFLRALLIWARRNGKDIISWNALIGKAAERTALYYYIGPQYNQIRQIVWEGTDKDGRRFLDYIPKEIIKRKDKQEMRITLVNDSQIKLVGSDNIDSIVGTNPLGAVFTEFSLHKPEAWDYLRPIFTENKDRGGWVIFNGTPRGKNHQYDMHQMAKTQDGWYVSHLSRDDTGVPSLEAIQKEREEGMEEELILQEFYTSYEAGLAGSYYSRQIAEVEKNGRLCSVNYNPSYRVFTAWDLGWNDSTTIWWFQVIKDNIYFLKCYSNRFKSLKHYAKVTSGQKYFYGAHFLPHDANAHELTSGMTRQERLETLGIQPTELVTRIKTTGDAEADLVASIRNTLSRCYFDKEKTAIGKESGFEALKSYRRQFDTINKRYRARPVKNWAKHFADAFMYALLAIKEHEEIVLDEDTLWDKRKSWNRINNKQQKQSELYTNPENYNPLTGKCELRR